DRVATGGRVGEAIVLADAHARRGGEEGCARQASGDRGRGEGGDADAADQGVPRCGHSHTPINTNDRIEISGTIVRILGGMSESLSAQVDDAAVDGRRARGDASRRAVLAHAADLTSIEGLDGLSIGRLAEVSGYSKSSIAGLFRNKEGLQLATVAAGRAVFIEVVVEPARVQPRGLPRLVALMRNVIEYSRTRVFAGGCFFAAVSADYDSKP